MPRKPIRILVVEDESIVAMDLKNSLQVLGYEVVGTVCCGEDAIAKAMESRPDLMLMDIMLKGEMDGIQAAEAIHEHLDIPVIFLTACADDVTLQRAKITGPFGYLIKPFEEWELRGHIEIALYKHDMERRLRESEERYSLATQGANDGLWDWDLVSNLIYFSPRWKEMLGYEDGQVGSSPEEWFKRLHSADVNQVREKLDQHLMGKSSHFECEYRILDAAGTYRWVLCRGLALRDPAGKATRCAGSQTDITDRKVYNPLTGLPNRILLMDRLERAIKRMKRLSNYSFAVIGLDVSDLKMIHDSLGHLLADQLLAQVAGRIQGCLSMQDTVAHCGEYDFILLCEEIRDARDALQVANRLHRAMEQPFQVDSQTVYVAATTGITVSNRDTACPEELLRDATTAMHRAKAAGKGRCEVFDHDMRTAILARIHLEADLRKAFDRREFKVHYQPIVCLKSGRMAGFEALVRWQRPSGLLLPGHFLPLAESTDLILPLENWVLHESCCQLAKWQSLFRTDQPLTMNVNLCAKHYSSPDLVPELKDVLHHSGLEPQTLRLEITESTLMENSETIARRLSEIRGLNVQIHMDDFGTGYSSLSYLHRLPITTLKIDRSFVNDLGLNGENLKIVQAIVNLAQNLGREVIAEGIENITQMRMLQSLGCEFGQGYYLSKPLDPNAIEGLATGQNPWAAAVGVDISQYLPFAVKDPQASLYA